MLNSLKPKSCQKNYSINFNVLLDLVRVIALSVHQNDLRLHQVGANWLFCTNVNHKPDTIQQ
ncbi:hypothetical protein [Vibrio gallaecicus]|uniref:hypothetical protein n=1 Tax=Vibrio gallaecicus TaxID=552386 RepID=UPI0025B38CEC|nr:hypothetical protein [Vibrio gallaecicus]MDN3614709.1 hypothetical protein [Vibrio gallaecicus]